MKWILFAAGLLAASAAWADDDQDLAMKALQNSEVLPLAQLLPKIETRYGARLLAIEFHNTGQTYVYDLELITPDGKMFEISVNAANGTVLAAGTGDTDDASEGIGN